MRRSAFARLKDNLCVHRPALKRIGMRKDDGRTRERGGLVAVRSRRVEQSFKDAGGSGQLDPRHMKPPGRLAESWKFCYTSARQTRSASTGSRCGRCRPV